MSISICELSSPGQKTACTRAVLESLPDWFGIPQAREDYIRQVKDLPYWAALEKDGRCVGFFAAAIHYGHTGEIVVCGIVPEYRHRGIGTALWRETEAYFLRSGCKYAIVETLSDTVENAAYAQTRQFYHSIGFEPLVTLTEMWDENNPCLIMFKTLEGAHDVS